MENIPHEDWMDELHEERRLKLLELDDAEFVADFQHCLDNAWNFNEQKFSNAHVALPRNLLFRVYIPVALHRLAPSMEAMPEFIDIDHDSLFRELIPADELLLDDLRTHEINRALQATAFLDASSLATAIRFAAPARSDAPRGFPTYDTALVHLYIPELVRRLSQN